MPISSWNQISGSGIVWKCSVELSVSYIHPKHPHAMAAKKTAAGFDFLVQALKANKSAEYSDLKQRAEQKGLTVFPVMFGRAKAMLGLVKSAKRGEGKAAKAAKSSAMRRGRPVDSSSKSGQIRELLKTGMSTAEIAKRVGCSVNLVYNVKSAAGKGRKRVATKRGPGRPARAAAAPTSFDALIETVKQNDRERSQMRRALEQIQAIIQNMV